MAREWGWIGCVGVGGPPAQIALLRQLCVERRRWLEAREFEDAIAATNLLLGPASTQLAIYCAWRLRGLLGALVGGVCFIVPGLVLIIALSALFLAGSPPEWLRGAGAGAGAAVAAVALQAGWSLAPPAWRRAADGQRQRLVVYAALGALAAATLGAWLVLVLLAAGLAEIVWQRAARLAGQMPRRLPGAQKSIERTSSGSTRSQPRIGRPRISIGRAFVAATSGSDSAGSTRTSNPP